jgi:tRNA G18 (ribose-2'-O)-methylase SpoU
MMSIKSKKQRKKKNQMVIEGKRLIQEAIKVGMVPETIIFSRFEDVKDLPISKTDTQLYKVPYRTIQLWSTLSTTPGIMGKFKVF